VTLQPRGILELTAIERIRRWQADLWRSRMLVTSPTARSADTRLPSAAVGLAEQLSRSPYDFKCFLDAKSLETGYSWRLQGRRALRKSSKIILLLTPGVLLSPGVRDERAAIHQDAGERGLAGTRLPNNVDVRKAVFGFDAEDTTIVAKVHASEVNGGFIHTLVLSL
jgi:hypothetical protein